MDDVTITDARRDMPSLIRQIEANPDDVSFGITVNGRRAAVLASPKRQSSTSTGWLDSHGLTREQLPAGIRDLLADDNRGTATLWIHIRTGAYVVLVPHGNWDEQGQPAAFYVSADRTSRAQLTWALGHWDGTKSTAYHDVLDDARRYVTRRLAEL